MNANEKKMMEQEAERIANLEALALARLDMVQEAVEQELDHVSEVDEQEVQLREVMTKMMASRGLVSAKPTTAMLGKLDGWREVVRERIVAIIKCHKPGAQVQVKISDIEINEEKSVKNGNSKVSVKVSKEAAIGKLVSSLMAEAKDTSEKLKDGTVKINKASFEAPYIIKAPTERKPYLTISFDMDK